LVMPAGIEPAISSLRG